MTQPTKTGVNCTTTAEIEAGLRVVAAIAEAIRDLCAVRPEGYPSGELYARLMGKLSIEQYNKILDLLTTNSMIKIDNYLITWIGPAKGE